MKEINEKEMEKATGGGDIPSFEELEERMAQKSSPAYIAKGYTLVTDQRRGMNCDDFFVPGKMGKGWCPICQRCVQAMDTLEYYCTMGH